MRPPELDVTFVLHHLDCYATEDTKWDEPYLWNLGFKVDAETLGPPPPGTIVPSLNVQVFEGVPASPWIVGPNSVESGQSPPIAPALGTRGCRLKPAFIPLLGWFPGLVGIVCLLWDQDGFAPSTSEVGHKKFKALFGPAATTELNRLAAGDYDDELAKDVNGVTLPDGPDGRTLQWRFSRLGDSGGRKNAVRAITNNIKNAVIGPVTDAIVNEAGLDELIDRDDLLGVQAQVYTGNELSGKQDFSLSFTDNDANYAARGFVTSSQVHRAVLDSVVTNVVRIPDKAIGLWLRVCWYPLKLYWAEAFKVHTTIRYHLGSTLGEEPAVVRWFIDDKPIPAGESSQLVVFDATDKYFGPPQNRLAKDFPGGPEPIKCRVAGATMDVWNDSGEGVYYGKVRALYSYAGDPSLFPPATLFALGYERSADLDLVAVQLEMNDDYREDLGQCEKTMHEIDRKRIPPNFGKLVIDPGDPPEWRQALADRYVADIRTASTLGMEVPSEQVLGQLNLRRPVRPK
jgi:hypothetical protein